MNCEDQVFDVDSLSQLKIVNIDSLSEMSNDLLSIRADILTNQQDVNLNLENLFSEHHSFLDFIKLECRKFESTLTKSCEKLMQKLLNLRITENQFFTIRDQMLKLGILNKEKISFFDFEALKSRDFDFFVKKLHSTYFDNAFANLRTLLDNFLELTYDSDGNNISISNKSTKKVLWTSLQENDLLHLMQKNYPESLTNQEISDFCDRHKRTKGAVINKIQKLKKKYADELKKQSDFIINCMLNGSYSERGIDDKIQDILMLKGAKTYEEILDELKINHTDVTSVENINRTLYDLLNKQRVNCKDQLYISNQQGYHKEGNSIILNKIGEIITNSGKEDLSFDTIKQGLIGHFKQLDPTKENFDNDLKEFIIGSNMFILKQKRVFYT